MDGRCILFCAAFERHICGILAQAKSLLLFEHIFLLRIDLRFQFPNLSIDTLFLSFAFSAFWANFFFFGNALYTLLVLFVGLD